MKTLIAAIMVVLSTVAAAAERVRVQRLPSAPSSPRGSSVAPSAPGPSSGFGPSDGGRVRVAPIPDDPRLRWREQHRRSNHRFHGGRHWYGFYHGPSFYWTHFHGGHWWWHDPHHHRWAYWQHDHWAWPDASMSVPAQAAPPPAPAPAAAAAEGGSWKSPDGRRMVQVTGTGAYLYDATKDPPGFLAFLARGAKQARFQGKLILIDLEDGAFALFDEAGRKVQR